MMMMMMIMMKMIMMKMIMMKMMMMMMMMMIMMMTMLIITIFQEYMTLIVPDPYSLTNQEIFHTIHGNGQVV